MNDAKNPNGAQRSSGALDPGELDRVCFEEAPVGMLATDSQGRFIVVNRQGTALTGYSREELSAWPSRISSIRKTRPGIRSAGMV